MADSTFMTEVPADKWPSLIPEMKLPQLDHLERDNVTIQCINSSDFVVGKQTNFNGPVTIINCMEVLKQGCHNRCKQNDEVVIEDKVLSRSAAMKVQKIASEKENRKKWEFLEGKVEVVRNLRKYSKVLIACVGIMTIVAIALVVLFSSDSDELALKCTALPGGSCIYSGFTWGGRPIPNELKRLKSPVPYVVVSQTFGEFCYGIDECIRLVKLFQQNVTDDLACNFLLGGDGNAYEDRGWSWENSLTGPAAGKSIEICFIGTYYDEFPTYPQFVLAKTFIQFAVDNNYLSKDYVLLASNATSPFLSVGSSVYEVIQKWPHFAENPFSL